MKEIDIDNSIIEEVEYEDIILNGVKSMQYDIRSIFEHSYKIKLSDQYQSLYDYMGILYQQKRF